MIIAGRNRGRIHAASATFERAGLGVRRGAPAPTPDAPSKLQPPERMRPPKEAPSSALDVVRTVLGATALGAVRSALGAVRATLDVVRQGLAAVRRGLGTIRRGLGVDTVVPLLLVALAVSAFVPWTRFELDTASDQVAVETTATLISALAASLFCVRFWQHLRLRDLLLAGGLVVIAASNLGADLLLAGNLLLAGHSAAWIVLGGRLAGWLLIAGSAVVPDRRLRRPTPTAIRTIVLGVTALAVLAALAVTFSASTTSYGALHSGPLGNPTAMLVAQILLALVTGVAAVAFGRETGRKGSPPARLLALACAFAASSALATCATPSFYASRVGIADILRLGWLAALFACVCVEWSLDERHAPVHALARERHRMAADVHDLIMQDLSLALANARTLTDDPARAAQVHTVVSAGERALAGARDVLSGLTEYSTQPIVEAVETSVRAAARHTPLTFDADNAPDLAQPDEPTRDALVHIAREAVTNAVKHARPGAIEVALEHDEEWRLTVRDDGRRQPRRLWPRQHAPPRRGTWGRAACAQQRAWRHDGGGVAPMSHAPTVVLADDHPVIRLGVRMALMRGGFEVLAEAADRDGAVEAVLRERPDVCLLDISMPGGGIEAAAILSHAVPGTALVMLTVSESPEDMLAALRSGAKGYLAKDTSPERLPAALYGVLRGEAALPRTLVGRVLHEFRHLPDPQDAPLRVDGVELTARESEILRMLRSGLSTVEIGKRLSLSPITVRRHISAGVAKLGASGRDDALRAIA
jgi:DNA-binding NarL/FixJ family response regulator/signal transduction histidine kinase